MKIALITDTHWGARNDSPLFLDYYEKFYSGTFFPTLDKEGIDTVIMLGDTFDRRKYINYLTLKRAKEIYFDELSKRKIKTFILVGNHDTTYKNTNEVNSIELLLEDYSNITAISGPKTINVDQHDICMMPWICPENYDISMAELKNTSATLCMGHFEIAGFAMHRGMQSQEGIDRAVFRKFALTFSGHYHHKSSSDSIYYLGNPYELTWQDYNDPRGFHLFDLDNRDLTFVQNPNVMFHRIIYDDKVESIKEINDKDLSKYKNTYVKVVVVNKTNAFLFDKFMNNLYNVNPADISVAEDFTELTEGLDDSMVDQAEDTLTILNKFVDGVKEDKIDNTRLKTLLKELYVEALHTET